MDLNAISQGSSSLPIFTYAAMQAAMLATAKRDSRSYDKKSELFIHVNRFPGALRQLQHSSTALIAVVMLFFACDEVREVLRSGIGNKTPWDATISRSLTEQTAVSVFEELKHVFLALTDLSSHDLVDLNGLGVSLSKVVVMHILT